MVKKSASDVTYYAISGVKTPGGANALFFSPLRVLMVVLQLAFKFKIIILYTDAAPH